MGSRPAKAEAVPLEEPVLLSHEGVQVRPTSEGVSNKKDASGLNDPPKTNNENTLDAGTTSEKSSPRGTALEDLGDDENPSNNTKNSTKAPKAKQKALTEEDAPSSIEVARSKTIELVENYSFETHRQNDIVRKNLVALKQIYFEFKNFPPEKATKCRRSIGMGFVETGLVPILAEITKDYITTGWRNAEGKEELKVFYKLYNSFILLFNYSDSTPAIAEAAADVGGFFEFIREQLKLNFPKHMEETSFTKCDETMLRNLLGFTHNCSSVDRARRRQHDLQYTDVLIPYLDSRVERFKMSSVLSLANIVDEKESEILNTSLEAVRFLLKSLGKAIKDKARRHMGWSAKELAHGVGKLASNDSNKKLLVTEGALPLLLELSSVGDEEDQSEAVGALWALSFHDDNKDSLITESGLIDKVIELSKSPVPEVRKAAQGVLWTCRYKLKETPQYQSVGEKLIGPDVVSSQSDKESGEETGNHVMISYQWDSQAILLRVRDALKDAGYRTWMDVDFMGGSTLQAMAEAVESSAVVLVCMSQRYKDSPNCRAEAEYAFQRRVPIIPLLMEPDYRPDGWLGILLGSKLFYDFSGKYPFETRLGGLVKELGPKGLHVSGHHENSAVVKPDVAKPKDEVDIGPKAIIPPVQSGILSSAPPSGQNSAREVVNWGKADVEKWLKQYELKRSALSELTGKQLLFLRDLKVEAPETFYGILRTNLELSSLGELMTFTQALVRLV